MRSLKHVLRRLKRAPMFTTIALVTLALGIGATTAIFSVVEGVLIKPLPYPQAESLVGVWHTATGLKGMGDAIMCSPTMYFTYREENRTFQNFGLYQVSGATVTGLAEPDVVPTLMVTYGTLGRLRFQEQARPDSAAALRPRQSVSRTTRLPRNRAAQAWRHASASQRRSGQDARDLAEGLAAGAWIRPRRL